MTLTLRILAILGLFALSTLPFAMAEGEDGDEDTVIVEGEGDTAHPDDSDNSEED